MFSKDDDGYNATRYSPVTQERQMISIRKAAYEISLSIYSLIVILKSPIESAIFKKEIGGRYGCIFFNWMCLNEIDKGFLTS